MGQTCRRFQKGVPSRLKFRRTTVRGFSSRTASRIAEICAVECAKIVSVANVISGGLRARAPHWQHVTVQVRAGARLCLVSARSLKKTTVAADNLLARVPARSSVSTRRKQTLHELRKQKTHPVSVTKASLQKRIGLSRSLREMGAQNNKITTAPWQVLVCAS